MSSPPQNWPRRQKRAPQAFANGLHAPPSQPPPGAHVLAQPSLQGMPPRHVRTSASGSRAAPPVACGRCVRGRASSGAWSAGCRHGLVEFRTCRSNMCDRSRTAHSSCDRPTAAPPCSPQLALTCAAARQRRKEQRQRRRGAARRPTHAGPPTPELKRVSVPVRLFAPVVSLVRCRVGAAGVKMGAAGQLAGQQTLIRCYFSVYHAIYEQGAAKDQGNRGWLSSCLPAPRPTARFELLRPALTRTAARGRLKLHRYTYKWSAATRSAQMSPLARALERFSGELRGFTSRISDGVAGLKRGAEARPHAGGEPGLNAQLWARPVQGPFQLCAQT